MMTILLTGLTGYLGSNLARAFVDEGYKVVGLVRSSSSLHRIDDVKNQLNLYIIEDDGIQKAFNDHIVDVVVHVAASYGRNGEAHSHLLESNLMFPLKVYEEALKNGCCFFLNTSTSLAEKVSPYALSKSQLNDWGKLISSTGKSKFLNLLLEHFYGPDDGDNKFTSYLIKSCLNNVEKIPLTKGEQERDFIYISDVVSAYMIIVRNSADIPVGYSEYGVGSGHAVTIQEFSGLIHALTQSKSNLSFGDIPYRENEPMFLQADISEMEKLGWKPEYTLKQGLSKTINEEKKK